MFDFVRTHQRLMQLLLLVLIVPSFALIGVSGYSTYVSGDHELATVGGNAITQEDFDQARRNQLQQMQSQNPAGFDPATLDTKEARTALLQSMIDSRVIATVASTNRFSVSDSVLRQAIASIPQLQVNGQFSAEKYKQVLTSMGLTSQGFEQNQRAQMALGEVLGPVASTASLPPSIVDAVERTLTAQRTIRLQIFAASQYKDKVKVSDADIKSWYDANKQQLKLPEQVSIKYLLLDEAAAMANIPAISQADMQKYYEQNKSRFTSKARINLSHILVSVPVGATKSQQEKAFSKAQAIAAEVAAGKASFADIARAKSDDAGTSGAGGELGWITQGTWPAKLDAAVFALKKGQVSGVVDGPGGYHIFKANDVQPAKIKSFDEAKPEITKEVRRQLGADRFADMATKLTSLVYDNSNSLQPAADALGLKVKSASGIARDQLLDASQAGPDAASAGPDAAVLGDIRVRQALFGTQVLTNKQNSGVIEISPDTMVVVRVSKVTPSHIPPLDKVTDTVRNTLVDKGALDLATKAGQAALAADQDAKGPASAPEGFGSAMDVSRINPQGLSKAVLDAALAAPATELPAYTSMTAPSAYVVIRIEKSTPGVTDDKKLAGLPAQLEGIWGAAEKTAVLEALRSHVKVKILPEADKVLAGNDQNQG